MSVGKIFCSPLPDEEIPQETRNNNLIICYDLVKIWKPPFKNPYKKGEFYKIGKEKEFHTIDGVKKIEWIVRKIHGWLVLYLLRK